MKQVRATKMGYYNNARIKEGQMFYVKDDKHFSKEWMEVVQENSVSHHNVNQNLTRRKPSQIVDNSDDVI